VETARQLFFQQGYGTTGFAQLLHASGANSGSLYYFFPTKEDLLVAVLERYKDMLQTHVIGPANERASDPVDRVFAVLDGYRQLLCATDYNLGCPIGNLALEVSNTYPRVRELINENFDAWCDAVTASLEAASGRFPAEIDLGHLSRYVLAVMEGAVLLARSHRDIGPFENAVHHLRDYFDRLLADGADWTTAPPD
jgi:TetR/AcrR family transcriptional repressor of nem operon